MMDEQLIGTEALADSAARTFAGLSVIGKVGELPPELAYSGIAAMAAHPDRAAVHMPELAILPDIAGTLTKIYDGECEAQALRDAVGAGSSYRARARQDRDETWAHRLGVGPQEAAAILDSTSEDRAAVEARARLYR